MSPTPAAVSIAHIVPARRIGATAPAARRLLVSLALALLTSLTGHAAWPQAAALSSPARPAADDAWQTFEATLSATGRRETLAVEHGGTAVALRLSGTLVVTRSDGLGKGFRAEFLGFDDGSGTGTARAVWTDAAGDRIFSRMVGTQMLAGRRTDAIITGGTGRFAGMTGRYTFIWQYVMPGEQDVVQVRISSMKGQYRVEPPR